MRVGSLLILTAISSVASAAQAAPPTTPSPVHVAVAPPARRVTPTTTPTTTHAPSVAEHEAPSAAVPSSIHLSPPPPAAAAPKASPQLVEFVKDAWTTKAPSLNYKPYRAALSGESMPAAVEQARGEPGASVFVVTRAPDQTEKRMVSIGGGRFAEKEVTVAGPELAPSSRLYIVRRSNFTTTIVDANGKVVAAGEDQTPGHGADFMHSSSTDWNARSPREVAKPPSLPARNPELRPSGGGSLPYTVPLAGSNMRVFTRDAGSFFEGGAETTSESDWGGRLIVPQPYLQLPGGKSLWVAPKVVNVKPIVDARTGKPVTDMMALEVDGRAARYEPRSRSDARPELSLEAYRRQFRGPGPLF